MHRLDFVVRILLFAIMVFGFQPIVNAEQSGFLQIPEDFKVLYVDGQKYSASLFSFGDTKLPLTVGEHRLVLSYDRIFEKDESIDRVKSEPFMLVFIAAPSADYQVLIQPVNNVEEGRLFAQQPTLSIVDVNTQKKADFQLKGQLQQAEFLAGFSSAAEQKKPTVTNMDEPVLKQLHYWWGKASDEEKSRFLEEEGIKP